MISYIYKCVRDGGHFAYTVLGIYIYKMYLDLLFRLDERMRRRPHPVFWDHRQRLRGGSRGEGGGGPGPPFQKV